MGNGLIKAIMTGNVALLLMSLEGLFKVGTAFFAFLAAGLSLVLLAYKERHTIKKMTGNDDPGKDTPQ